MRKLAPVLLAAVLLLSACSTTASPEADSETPAPSASAVETPAAVAPAETTPPAEPAAPAPSANDKTDFIVAALAPELQALVVSADQPEVGRINVYTTIVDPQGDNGSAEANSALAICEAVFALDGVDYGAIYKSDGTSFVLFGNPIIAPDGCTEV